MFEQLTWSLGMFSQAAFLILCSLYVLRDTVIVQTLIFTPDKLNCLNRFQRTLIPAISLTGVYLAMVAILNSVYGDTDSTATDWAVVVLLIGVLVIGPLAGLLTTLLVIPVRAFLVFNNDVESSITHTDANSELAFLNPLFWLDEIWVFQQPEVIQLLAAWLVGSLAYWLFRQRLNTEYPLYLGLPLAFAIQAAYTASAYLQWGNDHGFAYLTEEAGPSTVALAVTVLLFIMTLALARREFERKRTQAAELAAARDQLRYLNAQINPHFLNNALNSISNIMISSPDRARDLLCDLGDYFRTLCTWTDAIVPVSTEISTVKTYLALEQARFGSRLSVDVQIDDNCNQLSMPRMVLQPLVENAVRHAVEKTPNTSLITLSGKFEKGWLTFKVSDNGNGLMRSLTAEDYGVGLTNVNARLNRVYGDNTVFDISGVWGVGTVASVSLHLDSAQQSALPPIARSNNKIPANE